MLRNARVYVCTAAEPPTTKQFCDAIESGAWGPLGSFETSTLGFHALSDDGATAPVRAAGWLAARVRFTERKVSRKAINEAAGPRVADAERYHDRKLRASERREIVDEVRADLQRNAPPESDYAWCCYHPERRLVVMDCSTARCEAVLTFLRGLLGSLSIRPASFGRPADGAMTHWVHDTPPDSLVVGQSCDMEHPAETANKVRFRSQPLDEDDVIAALDRGMRVTALELVRELNECEPLVFTLHEDCTLRRIRHPSVHIETTDEDPIARLRADLTIALENITGTIDLLSRELGGMPELEKVA